MAADEDSIAALGSTHTFVRVCVHSGWGLILILILILRWPVPDACDVQHCLEHGWETFSAPPPQGRYFLRAVRMAL